VVVDAPIKSKKRKMFFDFIKKNVKVSQKKYNKINIFDANNEYDSFLTGSDQVFNLGCSNYDKAYFLKFVKDNKKKNSYAASFGFEKAPEKDVEEYGDLLKDFNNISIRENQGVKIVKDIVGRDAIEVLDPTMLLDKNDWSKIIKESKAKDEKYILVYGMKNADNLLVFAKKIQKLTNLPIIFIKDSLMKETDKNLTCNIKYRKDVSPAEWVELFLNSEYIVTNSFHGTAFSINFNKKFFTELLAPETKVNSRLENILDMFDLRDRQILESTIPTTEEIDYKKVNEILEEKKKISIDYLKNILAK
jgi:hypothetical protein